MTSPPPVLAGTAKFSVLSVGAAEIRSNAATTTTSSNESFVAASVQMSTNPQAVSYSALTLDPLALRLADAIGVQWAFGPTSRPPPKSDAHRSNHDDDDEALIVNATTNHTTAETTATDSTNRTLEVPVHTVSKAESPTTIPTATTTKAVTNATVTTTTTETTTTLVRDTLHGGFLVLQQSLVTAANPDIAVRQTPAPAVASQFATLPTATSRGANLPNDGRTEQRALPLFLAQLPSQLPCNNRTDEWKRDELAVLFRASVPGLEPSPEQPAVKSTTTPETYTPVTEPTLESSPHQDDTPVQSTSRAVAISPSFDLVEEPVITTAGMGIASHGKVSSEYALAPEPDSHTKEALDHGEIPAETESKMTEPRASSAGLDCIAPDPIEPNVMEPATTDTLVTTNLTAAALSEPAEPPTMTQPLETTVEPTADVKAAERDFAFKPEPIKTDEIDPQPNVLDSAPVESVGHVNNDGQASASATQVIESMIANSFQSHELAVCHFCVCCDLH
jgi:hypothetical protein